MGIKNIRQFEEFNIEDFLTQQRLLVTGVRAWNEYGTDKHIGTAVEVTIINDNTVYLDNDGNKLEGITNRFEKLTFKVAKDVDIALDAIVTPVHAVAKVYAQKGSNVRNQLSIKCDDIKVVGHAKGA